MVITARVLDVAQNAQFLVFWSLLFFCFGLLGGIQNEATRAVRSVQGTRGAGVRPLPVALVMGALLAIVVVVTQRLWATQWFPTTSTAVVVAVSVSVVLFAGHSALAGTLAGRGLWHTFAVLVSAESLLRLALVSTAVLVGWRAGGLELGAAFAAGAWVLLCLVAPGARSSLSTRSDVGLRKFLSQSVQAMLATAATAALLVGFPVLLRITSSTTEYAEAAPLLLAISFTRAPLMLAVNAFQGVAITTFISRTERRGHLLIRLVASLTVAGLIGAVLAGVAGPWLFETILGPAYRLEPVLLAVLMIASVLLATLTLTGALALALNRHRLYAAGWVAALVVSFLALAVPGDLASRAQLSLVVGPVVGCLVHGVGIRRDLGKVPS